MPLLQVRNMPDDLYDVLSATAERERRSVAQETIVLLRSSLMRPISQQERVQAIFREVNESPPTPLRDDPYPDPVALIREDRDR
ncbi:MAG: hypothetical protein LBM23_00880 [Propionibacteriaceae bacterium]|nr:hypothetical protein [Propionibacteriaceae bacterium]